MRFFVEDILWAMELAKRKLQQHLLLPSRITLPTTPQVIQRGQKI